MTCQIQGQQVSNCLQDVAWPANTDTVIFVAFFMPTTTTSLPAQEIRFVSDIGNLTVVTAP